MPTSTFLDRARAGEAVYINEVRQVFGSLSGTWQLRCELTGVDYTTRHYELALPALTSLSAEETSFVTEYFLASMYNLLSSLGGRGVRFSGSRQAEVDILSGAFSEAFGLSLPRSERSGYGRCLNVAERMVDALDSGSDGQFSVNSSFSSAARQEDQLGRGIAELCRRATSLSGASICGIDVGGTDIKVALVLDETIVAYKEYDWFPASFTEIRQLIEPIEAIVRLIRLAAIAHRRDDKALAAVLAPALEPSAGDSDIAAAISTGQELAQGDDFAFDGIGMCFPDVVVGNKIVGGEVYKVRGIRAAHPTDFDVSFRKLCNLDEVLSKYVSGNGVVRILNDGPMAAFTAAVETAAIDSDSVSEGVFAHTLGTELGTGWVTETGVVPDIPLEVYNCIIDLGSYPERVFEPDDLRSVLNFNTRLPGTLQKYASQSGVFRLAMKYLPNDDPEMLADLLSRGLITGSAADGFYVPTTPIDQRKPLLEYFMTALERDQNSAVQRIFTEIGAFLGVAYLETVWLLEPATKTRVQFGRLVKHSSCFAAMAAGAKEVAPELCLTVADDTLAATPLMQQLAAHPTYTVAQFAQAIGAAYWANVELRAD